MSTSIPNDDKPIRIDKWLWAARFFKTRSLAKQAIEGGKVHYNGQRVKTSKAVELGAEIKVRCGWDDKIVLVLALSDQRRNATEASKLYNETSASIASREAHAAERKAIRGSAPEFSNRPSKKQRRQIHRFKQTGTPDD
ncbi:S4 domain-containing protein [Pseudomonadales bacterium]|jgi:ribosome-associated heat shock protein Hsp15|nr:S4 domain-containing protein [Pseudomonadales bacterium]MDB4430786.1 S4 domain-containing protein [Pseudomonadales bacterium]MDB4528905.1 S4 domain-containing protein [Pseudomonadales bacterium]MDB4542045.1 S4 domain-containing protein [Pseudomonadales bacterium]MDB4806563.1 S4 domain-containing protein [Pseudomonadales bacterium]